MTAARPRSSRWTQVPDKEAPVPHISRWCMSILIAGLAAACAPAVPALPSTATAPATGTAAHSAAVASAAVPVAPRPGDAAPDFSLPDSTGTLVNLDSVVADHQSTVLIFYLSHT